MATNIRRIWGFGALGCVMALIAASLLMSGGDDARASSPDAGSFALARVVIDDEYIEACSDGQAVKFPERNPGLVADCAALLASKDHLIGQDGGGFRWGGARDIREWNGITVALVDDGATYRVTSVVVSLF